MVTLALAAMATPSVAAQRLKLDRSLPELEKAAVRDSNDAAAHYNVALGYWSVKRFDEARRSLLQAVAIEPRFASAHLALAFLPYAERPRLWNETLRDRIPEEWKATVEASERSYRLAFHIDPMVDLRIMGAVEPAKDLAFEIDEFWSKVYGLLWQGFDDFRDAKYEQAYGRFQRMANEFDWDRHQDKMPDYILRYRGLAAAHSGRSDKAIADFRLLVSRADKAERRDSLVINPLRANDYRFILAALYQQAGHPDSAIALYRQALERDLGLFMAHVQMANIYEGMRQYDEALAERQRAVNANAEDGTLLLDLGVTLGKAGRFPESADALAQAHERNPRDARSLFWLGLAEQQRNRREEARRAYERFLELAPGRFDRQIAMARQRLADLR